MSTQNATPAGLLAAIAGTALAAFSPLAQAQTASAASPRSRAISPASVQTAGAATTSARPGVTPDRGHPRLNVTPSSVQMTQLAHRFRRDIAGERLAQIMLERQREPVDRAVERMLRSLDQLRAVKWDLPTRDNLNTSAPAAPASDGGDDPIGDAGNTAADLDAAPGGVFVPRSWGVVSTPQGDEVQIPYTIDQEIIDAFFFPDNNDPLGSSSSYNELQALPNILAILLLLETDLEEFNIEFVAYNPSIHDRAVLFQSISIDPLFVPEFFALSDQDTLDGEVCLNSVDGFGAPTDPVNDDDPVLLLDDTVGGNPARLIVHCDWSDVGNLTRQIGFVLGLAWHQTWESPTSDLTRDDFIEIFPQNIIPIGPGTPQFPFTIAGTNVTERLAQWDTNVPESWVSLGGYDPFSIVHQDAFSFSVNLLEVFLPEPLILQTQAVAIENQRRASATPPIAPIQGTSPNASQAEIDAGLDELINIMGFGVEFSVGDRNVIAAVIDSDRYYVNENPECPVDVNRDLLQNFDDLLAFSALFAAGDSAADVNRNGFLDPQDYADFFALYTPGDCRDFDPDGAGNGFVRDNGCPFDIVGDDFLTTFDGGLVSFNADGQQNWADLIAFNELFKAGDISTDLFPDLLLNAADFQALSGDFTAGRCADVDDQNFAFDPSVCPNDVNLDGFQNFADLVTFANLVAADEPIADLDFDGVRDFNDYLLFAAEIDGNEGECVESLANPRPDGCDFDLASEAPDGGFELVADGFQDWNDRLAFATIIGEGRADPDGTVGDTSVLVANLDGNGILDSADYAAFDTGFTVGQCNPGGGALIADGCEFDLDNNRVQNWLDRAAFASIAGVTSRTPDGSTQVADLNFDNIINGADYGTFVGRFAEGECQLGLAAPVPSFCEFDVNNDNVQDWQDLLLFEQLLLTGDPVANLTFDFTINFQDRNAFLAQTRAAGGIVPDPANPGFFGTCAINGQPPIFDGCTVDLSGPPDADGNFDYIPDGQQNWIDRLAYAQLLMSGNLITDFNGNGVIDGGQLGVAPEGGDFAVFRIAADDGTDDGLFDNLGACVPAGAAIPQPNGCRFDINVDGIQDTADLVLFGELVLAGNPAADINGDSFIDEFDINLFNQEFSTGECNVDPNDPDSDPNNPSPDGCPFDFNGDGIQSAADRAFFIDLYNSGNPVADFNGDGNVNITDLQEFIAAFQPGFCSPDSPTPTPGNRPGGFGNTNPT